MDCYQTSWSYMASMGHMECVEHHWIQWSNSRLHNAHQIGDQFTAGVQYVEVCTKSMKSGKNMLKVDLVKAKTIIYTKYSAFALPSDITI